MKKLQWLGVGGLVVLMGVVGWVLGTTGSAPPQEQSHEFRAAQGKAREGARPMVRRNPDETAAAPGTASTPQAEGASAPPDPASEPPPPDPAGPGAAGTPAHGAAGGEGAAPAGLAPRIGPDFSHLSPPTAAAIRHALANIDPAAAIENLLDHLSTLDRLAASASVYYTIGTLHLRQVPPHPAEARAAALNAREFATDAEQRARAMLLEAKALAAGGDAAGALAVLRAAEAPTGTPVAIEQRLYAGMLHETLGDSAAAEAAYRAALDERVEGTPAAGEGPWREAARKLARLLRASGRDAEAAEVVRAMRVGNTAGGAAQGP
jgi:hypothetical protein